MRLAIFPVTASKAIGMLEVKIYVIGVIEIDPVVASPEPWISLAGDDDTLEAVLARLAGRPARQSGGEAPRAPEGPWSRAIPDDAGRPGTGIRAVPPPCSSPLPQRVVANLAGLSADLNLHLAQMRTHLQAAAMSSGPSQ